jgi:uncharacterized protein (DUF302 family)
MNRLRSVLILSILVGTAAHAQGPAQPAATPQMTQQQMQEAMLRQMQMMAVMFDLKTSRLGFEETVSAIRGAAEKRGWKVDQVHDVQAAMKAEGVKDAPRMKVIATCPKDANEQLAKASQGKAPPLPCRVTVFEAKDGKIQVMRLNTGMLAKGTQGETAKVLAQIAAEEEAVLQGIVQ